MSTEIKSAINRIRAACVNLEESGTAYSSSTLNLLDSSGIPHSVAFQHVYSIRYSDEDNEELVSVTITVTQGKPGI